MSDERIHEEEIAEEIEAMAEDVETVDEELAAVSAGLDELLNGHTDGEVAAHEDEAPRVEAALPRESDPNVLPDLPPLKVTAAVPPAPRADKPMVTPAAPTAPAAKVPAPATRAAQQKTLDFSIPLPSMPAAGQPTRPDLTVSLPDPRRFTDYLSSMGDRTWLGVLAGGLLLVEGIMSVMLGVTYHPNALLVVLISAAALGILVSSDSRKLLLGFSAAVVAAFAQVSTSAGGTLLNFAAAIVFYRVARYGGNLARYALLLMGVPLASFFMGLAFGNMADMLLSGQIVWTLFSSASPTLLALLSLAIFGGAWFMGNAARRTDAATASLEEVSVERDTAAATAIAAAEERDVVAEIARLKEEQAALAHDVHDVVGHSLAVVLAQAESAAFLPDDDVAALRQAIANIEGAARTALKEVRQVLGSAKSADESEVVGDPLDLIDSARSAGYEVLYTEYGTPVELSTGVATVSYRVLQELLTNAIKHGTREEPIQVVRQFTDDSLVIRVVNRFDPQATATFGIGSGHDGIRHRLLRTGGHLDLTRTNDAPGVNRFVATAHVIM